MFADLNQMTGLEMADSYRSRALSPVEVIQETFKHIDVFEPKVNAFTHLDREGALTTAKASEQRWLKGEQLGPLDGVPATIKDIIDCKDWVTSFGSNIFNNKEPAKADAPCVARLKEAGACLLGLTTTPEIGWKGVTDSPRSGITRNPWDTSKTTGGSSGGAAAAAALGIGRLHVGTDGGGSIRIPSGFSGTVGHKPSFGRVPAYPPSAFGTVAHVGPITRSVCDAAAMLNILAQPDARDWYALPPQNTDYLAGISDGIKDLKIAYSPTLGYVDVDEEVAASVDEAVKALTALGAHVDVVDPGFKCPQNIYHTLWFSGAVKRTEMLNDEQKEALDPELQAIIAEGLHYTLSDYMEAIHQRSELGSHMRQFHKTYDLLVTPTLPIPAFEAGLECLPHQKRWTDWAAFNYPFNLTQQPACSVPCGLTRNGLPIGLQIVGPMFADKLVLRAAYAFEQTRDWKFPTIMT